MDLIEDFPAQSARTGRFTHGLPKAFTLGNEHVLFLRTAGPEDPTSCLWQLTATGEEQLVVAPEDLDAGGALPEAERVRRERGRERTFGIVAYSTDRSARQIVFALQGVLYHLDGPEALPREIWTAGRVVDPRIDPTGRRVAYVTGRQLHVVDLADGTNRAVAADDDPEVSWGLAEHEAAESMGRTRGHWWSPDGTRLLAARVDQTPVQRWWIADPANPERPPREVAYPVAGTANAIVTLHAFDLDGGAVELRWDRPAYEYLTAATWDAHGPLFAVQSRDQRTLLVLAGDPGTGDTKVLHEQRDAAWVELIPGTPARTASGRLVHTADAGQTRHLTIDDVRVTPDGLQVRDVLHVDGEAILFVASDEPTEDHLWLYDGELRQLSGEPGMHTGSRTEDALLIDSNTEAGRSFVVRRPGQPDRTIESRAAEPLVTPRITWLRAGELELRTAVLLPSWYEGGQLPVLMSPYGGPAAQLVLKRSGGAFATAQWFAEQGFAVVIADGRGTPGRGPAWEKTVYLDTLTAPLEDQVTALHAAAEQTGALDLTRVGIRGWSFGGLLAAAAVLLRPDDFHVAVAGAAPADQRLYDTHWRERFLGHPDENPEVYDRLSPMTYAADLRRPLLLVHGLADDNVFAAHTLRLSAALTAAGRPHQVLPLSNVTHMADSSSLTHYELGFLSAHLRPATPGTPSAR
ncbi:prolyl oligopeptidase family serine peptidase [Kribbella jejuensis]|uniref:Dipeptidyl-peptidase-4 n=1 Tax=Kribbella jejuensis TaxID=236068 RepID=A0A542ERD1_9ACTN|nr:prolyl oligopeptidase family serine peptidase [Kribbella jejuensis]TQJ17774.1 dipeptidyl-peptidase-4 [Kribbella jejuensis]